MFNQCVSIIIKLPINLLQIPSMLSIWKSTRQLYTSQNCIFLTNIIGWPNIVRRRHKLHLCNCCQLRFGHTLEVSRPFYPTLDEYENGGFTLKTFPSTLRQRHLKTQQLPVILNMCLTKTRSGKSQNVFRPHETDENSAFSKISGLPPFSLIRDFRKQNTRRTFPQFPSIIHVIDRSDRNPPITAR